MRFFNLSFAFLIGPTAERQINMLNHSKFLVPCAVPKLIGRPKQPFSHGDKTSRGRPTVQTGRLDHLYPAATALSYSHPTIRVASPGDNILKTLKEHIPIVPGYSITDGLDIRFLVLK